MIVWPGNLITETRNISFKDANAEKEKYES